MINCIHLVVFSYNKRCLKINHTFFADGTDKIFYQKYVLYCLFVRIPKILKLLLLIKYTFLQKNTSSICFCITFRILSKLSSSLLTSCLVISSISVLCLRFHMHLGLLAILYHATMLHSCLVLNSIFLFSPKTPSFSICQGNCIFRV